MSVQSLGTARPRRTARPPLLDVAAEVLVTNPGASLAEVAEAAGIGRTTLHKHYATREDLLRAVGHRAIDLWEKALDEVTDGPDGGLRAITAAMVAIGLQLGFVWRTPVLDGDHDLTQRWNAMEERGLAVLRRAQDRGVLAPGTPDWWLLHTFYSLIYVAADNVSAGRLAPFDAPDLVIRTFLRGVGPPLLLPAPTPKDERA
ncbi:MAG: TetR/AcrR family transcriptional regulator [Streptosporangiaceae bacterium]